jgi:hypothetical protein
LQRNKYHKSFNFLHLEEGAAIAERNGAVAVAAGARPQPTVELPATARP